MFFGLWRSQVLQSVELSPLATSQRRSPEGGWRQGGYWNTSHTVVFSALWRSQVLQCVELRLLVLHSVELSPLFISQRASGLLPNVAQKVARQAIDHKSGTRKIAGQAVDHESGIRKIAGQAVDRVAQNTHW